MTGIICAFIGLDLKKWSIWRLGLYVFVTGIWLGQFSSGEASRYPVKVGLEMGLFLNFIVIIGGTVTRYQRQYYKDAAKNWLMRYGNDENPAIKMIAGLLRKLTI